MVSFRNSFLIYPFLGKIRDFPLKGREFYLSLMQKLCRAVQTNELDWVNTFVWVFYPRGELPCFETGRLFDWLPIF